MNAKQEAFCREYAKGKSATLAAYLAGYSRKNAGSQGSRLLKNANIRKRVDELQGQAANGAKVEGAQVIRELAALAFSDIRQVCSWTEDGQVELKPYNEIDASAAAAIQTIHIGQRGPTVRMHDKLRALSELAEYLGLHDHANREGVAQQPPKLVIHITERESKPRLEEKEPKSGQANDIE